MKLSTGKLKTGILLATLTAGSALAQIPNVIEHVQQKMNGVQQQNKTASDDALNGGVTNGTTAKASAGKPAASTAKPVVAAKPAAATVKQAANSKPTSTPVPALVVKKTTAVAPASQKASTTPATAKAALANVSAAKAQAAQVATAKLPAANVPVAKVPAAKAAANVAAVKPAAAAAKPVVANAKSSVVKPVVAAAVGAAAAVAVVKHDPFAKTAAPKADAKANAVAAKTDTTTAKADTKADAKASAKPVTPAADANKAAATTADAKAGDAAPAEAKDDASDKKKEGFITAGNRRDPFVSPIVQHMTGSGCSTGKRCLAIDQIALRGIVKSEAGMIAVVVNSLDKAYFLRENDPVFNGYVLKISGDSVVFKETVQDRLGHLSTREVVKKITTPAV